MALLGAARGHAARALPPALTAPAAALLLAHLALLPSLPPEWRGAAALAILLAPGALLALLLFPDASPAARAFLAICGAIAMAPLIVLPIHAIPGPIAWWAPALLADGLTLLVGAAWARRATTEGRAGDHEDRPNMGRPDKSSPDKGRRYIIVVLLLGAALRLPALGGAEFQGDEGRAILMAADALHGADDILLLHKKGPAEVLLPLGPLAITGQIDETVARLPFALAGLGAVLGAYVLGRALLGAQGAAGGLIASLALALDGFMIGFSRIVQYQSALVLLVCGAVYLAWRFYDSAPNPRRMLLALAGLVASALLAHYDAIWCLPALGWLVLAGGRRRGWNVREWLGHLLPPALLGGGLLASFYVPFALNARFGRTLEYLGGRTGQGGGAIALYNNLPYYADVSTFYNTTFGMAASSAALLGGLCAWLVLFVRPRALGWALAALLLGAVGLAWRAPEMLALGEDLSLAGPLVLLPLLALALAPRTPAGLRAVALWFAAGLAAKAFLVARPNTHFYVMHAPAALLAGLAAARLWAFVRTENREPRTTDHRGATQILAAGAQAALAIGGAALLMLAVPYAYILLLRQEPEYRRSFPEQRAPIFQAPYGDEVPRFANFGFPHRAGYKVVGELFARGIISGSYIANEEELITGWYLRGAFRCPANADIVLLATRPLDRVRLDEREVRETYHLLGIVTTDGVGKLEIWSRAPVGAEPVAFRLEDYQAAFDARPVDDFPTQRSLAEVTPQHRLDADWREGARLVGYDMDPTAAAAGGAAFVSLYWRTPLAPESGGNGYEPAVELVDSGGRVVGAAEPTCDPPNGEWYWQWLSGVSYRLAPDAALPPGEYALRVSLRRPDGARLPLADGRDALEIGAVRITSPMESRSGPSAPQP